MEELTALYRRLAKQAHPDTGPASERGIRHILMQQINVAYAAKDVALLQRLATEVDTFSLDPAPAQPRETRTSEPPKPETKRQPSPGDQRSQRHEDESRTAFRTEAEQRRLEQEAEDAFEEYIRAYKTLLDGALMINGRREGKIADELQQAYYIAASRCASTPDEIKHWETVVNRWKGKLPKEPMSEEEINRRINLSNDKLDPYARNARTVKEKFNDYLEVFLHVHLGEMFAKLPENRHFMAIRYREYLRLRLRGDL